MTAPEDPAFGGCFGFLKPRQFKKALGAMPPPAQSPQRRDTLFVRAIGAPWMARPSMGYVGLHTTFSAREVGRPWPEVLCSRTRERQRLHTCTPSLTFPPKCPGIGQAQRRIVGSLGRVR